MHAQSLRMLALESPALLKLAGLATGMGIFDYRFDKGTGRADDQARELIGAEPDTEISLPALLPFVHQADREAVEHAIANASRQHGSNRFTAEFRVHKRPGESEQWIEARGVVEFENGKPIYLIGATRDVTLEKQLVAARVEDMEQIQRANIALSQAQEALRTADRRKDEFLATLAHELRGPLSPIRNAVEILRLAGDDPARVAHASRIIDRQLTHMTRLIEDLLDIARVRMGLVELRLSRVSLRATLDQALESVQSKIAEARHTLHVSHPYPDVHLLADPVRLAQVFNNLISNSIKYSEPGGRLQLTSRTSEDSVLISLRDSGIGIAPHMLEEIFGLFRRADGAVAHATTGVGIGLSLVRQLVEAHGGTVQAYSEGPGKGSEFIVQLPLAT